MTDHTTLWHSNLIGPLLDLTIPVQLWWVTCKAYLSVINPFHLKDIYITTFFYTTTLENQQCHVFIAVHVSKTDARRSTDCHVIVVRFNWLVKETTVQCVHVTYVNMSKIISTVPHLGFEFQYDHEDRLNGTNCPPSTLQMSPRTSCPHSVPS